MKRLYSILALVALMAMTAVTMTSCFSDDDPTYVKILKITADGYDSGVLRVPVGSVIYLSAESVPDGIKHTKNVTWSSSDPSVASIDQEGGLFASKVGTTVITCTFSNDWGSATATITVEVTEGGLPIHSNDPIDQSNAQSRSM